MDSNLPDLLWHAMGLDYSARIVHWRPPCEMRGALHGPRTRAAGWGAPGAKSGVHNLCQLLNKVEAQMPWGALSVARRLPPTESVFQGRGIGSSV